jgi:hypothetical protein
LLLRPARRAQFLDILGSGPRSSSGDQFHVLHQGALRSREARRFQLAFENCRYALIGRSLNPQEVSVAVQSIGAPVQIRHITRDHFFVASREMSLRKMDGIRELDHLTQKIGTRSETLDDAGDLLSSRATSPKVISSCSFPRGVGILDNLDLGCWCSFIRGHRLRLAPAAWSSNNKSYTPSRCEALVFS